MVLPHLFQGQISPATSGGRGWGVWWYSGVSGPMWVMLVCEDLRISHIVMVHLTPVCRVVYMSVTLICLCRQLWPALQSVTRPLQRNFTHNGELRLPMGWWSSFLWCEQRQSLPWNEGASCVLLCTVYILFLSRASEWLVIGEICRLLRRSLWSMWRVRTWMSMMCRLAGPWLMAVCCSVSALTIKLKPDMWNIMDTVLHYGGKKKLLIVKLKLQSL